MNIFKRKPITATQTVGIDKSRILNHDSAFVVKETYKTLRTNIMFALPNEDEEPNGKVIVFTSAVPGEGKTTVCLNTAITFAQTGARVLIIDSDLRIPKLHKYFGIDGKTGFSDVLGGFANVQSVITPIKEYNLDCIPGGQIPPNPAELLGSKTTANLLDELKKLYDYIIIDTPPVTVVADALALAPIASGTVIIAREKYTPNTSVREVLQALKFANAKVLGIVNNCANITQMGYRKSGFGYRYLYGYKQNYRYRYYGYDNKK
ncbi:MAG: CpsD/CapB family tyrosine-protein kinase [Clostridia bacterium]|nr:CpsD/CapB family tyrosine-protein kinase [Clostridia bacterium]